MISVDALVRDGPSFPIFITDDNETDYFVGLASDTGCRLAPSCLNCPLPQCIHDAPTAGQVLRLAGRTRDAEKAKLYWDTVESDGPSTAMAKVREDYGITERTVHRILRRHREVMAL